MNKLKNHQEKIHWKGELSGAFGDIGTDLPLIVALVLATGLNGFLVFLVYGFFQIGVGFWYQLPVPLQPLKLMTTVVLTLHLSAESFLLSGWMIGLVMLFLTYSGLLTKISNMTPTFVIRGLQIGLGFKLLKLGGQQYLWDVYPDYGWSIPVMLGLILIVVVLFILLRKKNQFPVSLAILILGGIYTYFTSNGHLPTFAQKSTSIHFYHYVSQLKFAEILNLMTLLVIPQLALSISNSIVASQKTIQDYFPESNIAVKDLGKSYSILNIIAPFLGGIPVCHGAGGVVGHYVYGGRKGYSVMIYGVFFLLLGVLWQLFELKIFKIFPLPVLGILVAIQGIFLIGFIRDLKNNITLFFLSLLVASIAIFIPYGFGIGMVIGILIQIIWKNSTTLRNKKYL